MLFIVYVCPNYTANAVRFIDMLSRLPEVQLGLIAQEPTSLLPAAVQSRITGFRQITDVFNADQLIKAARSLQADHGKLHRLIAAVEPLQVPLAKARMLLGVEGMDVETATNFRDKHRMKMLFRKADLPCARSQEVRGREAAVAFAGDVGYPLVVKPPDGAGSLKTFKVQNQTELEGALAHMAGAPALLEEFVIGTEHSFDTFSLNGKPVFHTLSHYFPNPLEVMREPWIQWQVLIPREVDDPKYDDIREAAFQALSTLGMGTGLSHLEWFRRPDGSIAISEVAARPPGAQFLTLIGRACDFDALEAWGRLMVFGTFEVPERKYAVGAAYLRGQGKGKVKAVQGLDVVHAELKDLITDHKIPGIGQEAAPNYEGEGYIIIRHPETEVVRRALSRIVSVVRVELG
ncbi:MAG: ATP-grasp domain-containing protein [Bacteroidetes bacterium]|nr:MAG: ATP-grasp domain-containing protein [Bacteroidota bacterium]